MTTAQLRVFVGERLAPYKVPRRVVVVEALPRGRTGKIERTNLAATLGLDAPAASERTSARVHVDATDDVERELCSIWQRVLDLDVPPSTDREFLELGDSLNATELLVDVEEAVRPPASRDDLPHGRDGADDGRGLAGLRDVARRALRCSPSRSAGRGRRCSVCCAAEP